MKTISMLLALLAANACLFAQSQGPSSIYNSLSSADKAQIDAFYCERPPYVLGWNWNTALKGVNQGLGTNASHCYYPFRWTTTTGARVKDYIRHTTDGMCLIMAPDWEIPYDRYADSVTSHYRWFTDAIDDDSGTPHEDIIPLTLGQGTTTSLNHALGLRFEPELDMSDTTVFTPRSGDQQGAVWGFRTRDLTHGSTTTNTSDANFHRYSLSASGVTGWTSVLNQSWPDQRLGRWTHLKDYEQMRSFNGDKMYVSINVRRTNAADTVSDSEPLLRLTVHCQLTDINNTVQLINLDSIPHATAGNVPLPDRLDGGSRGLVHPLQDAGTEKVTSFTITRGMLPRGDATERDVTVMAHCHLVPLNTHGVHDEDANHFLRDRWRVMSEFQDIERQDPGNSNCHIARLWVEVEYAGESDVAIDWVQVGTENFTWFTQGYYDSTCREGYRVISDTMTRWNTLTYGTGAPERLRLWRWYNRDEGNEAYFTGIAYMNHLFDGKTILEGTEFSEKAIVDRYLYTTGITDIWTGASMRITARTTAPYYRKGHGGMNDPTYLGYSFGVDQTVSQDTIDYDLFWGTKTVGGVVTTALPPVMNATPDDDDAGYPVGMQTSIGLQGAFERDRYLLHTGCTYLFNHTIPWIANLWLSPDLLSVDDSQSKPYLINPTDWTRQQTGEETTLAAWSQVILGAKGLMHWWGVMADSIRQHAYYRENGQLSMGLCYGPAKERISEYQWDAPNQEWDAVSPSPLRDPTKTLAENITLADARTAELMVRLPRDPAVGPDYLDSNNSFGLWSVMQENGCPYPGVGSLGESFDASLDALYGDRDTGEYYIGMLSQRSALQSVYEVLGRASAALSGLRLRAWYSKGFRTWLDEDTTFLSKVIDTSKIRTRHPLRDAGPNADPAVMTWESTDSSFIEMTILQEGTQPLEEGFVLGVLNRRCNPYDYDAADTITNGNHVDLSTYHTYNEHRQRILAASGSEKVPMRYRQAGARMIEIPFNDSLFLGEARNLHIEHLGVVDEDSLGIIAFDTVIGRNVPLRICLMPGEGCMLRITSVAASSTDLSHTGYLDHSNQRKLVAFPKVVAMTEVTDTVDMRTYWRMVAGDTMWYHQVYHRRRDLPGYPEDGYLSVFYRRSKPLCTSHDTLPGTDYVFDASTITWEEPILVSDRVLFNGDTADLSCGYPALVARPAEIAPNVWVGRVYIVFGCEDYQSVQGQPQVLVCETVLPAETARQDQYDYYQQHASEVLDITPAPNEPLLQHWGTPMVNASQEGNYYCWSHAQYGIGVGFKVPTARLFTQDQVEYIKHNNGMIGLHPSLNTYSRLQIAEEDAALVWQEGTGVADNASNGICYTRLWNTGAPNFNIYHELHPGYSLITDGVPFVSQQDPTIGIVEDGYVSLVPDTVTFNAASAYPVVYRMLSDWDDTPANHRYDLRQVNYKADRVYWQSQRVHLGLGPWMIGQRNVDFADSSISPASGIDYSFTSPANYIRSDSLNLRGPDGVQGEQWGELGSVPDNPWPWYDDSTIVLNFWSDTSDDDPLPAIWHMHFGYSFYGYVKDTSAHYDFLDTNLIASGLMQRITGQGRYPHLAARYSVTANRGYQRSRRIYNEPGGVWATYQLAPPITTSSQYFYKPTGNKAEPTARYYRGFRGKASAALVGELTASNGVSIALTGMVGDKPVFGYKQMPEQYVSSWFTIDGAVDIGLATRVLGASPAALLFVERYSDGARLKIEAITSKRTAEKLKQKVTMLGTKADKYRLILEPVADSVYPVGDVILQMPEETSMPKTAGQSIYLGIIDLRTMQQASVVQGSVSVYPNPVADMVHIAFTCRQNTQIVIPDAIAALAAGNNAATLTISDARGNIVYTTDCNTTDAVAVSTTAMPSGIYHIMIQPHGSAYMPNTATVTVIH